MAHSFPYEQLSHNSKQFTRDKDTMGTAVHIGLAIMLFLIQNWIGSRAYSRGYVRFSLLDDKDEALSLNYVIKVFGPIVYLIICVAGLQYVGLDYLIDGIFSVVYYYLSIRLALIVLYERAAIVNWIRITFYYASIIIISTIVYNKFINSVGNLLPDFSEIKNEIWLLIIAFLYQVGNSVEEKYPNNQLFETTNTYLPELKKRKRKYILRKHQEFRQQYERIVADISKGDLPFNVIIYSILIFENFNRPRIIRWLERFWVRIIRTGVTQGIMQTSSDKPICDEDSVITGTTFLFKKYLEFTGESYPNRVFARTIKRHCPDKKYIRQVLFIAKCIIDHDQSNEKYSKLNEEIKSEFGLYDND